MKITTRKDKSGFTIIEISMVLVIIGLVVGGVVVGRELIEIGKIRSAISQLEQFSTAANTFKIKYGSLPGDISATKAQAVGLRYIHYSPIGVYGNEDGSYIAYADWLSDEPAFFFMQLGDAGLIPGNYNWYRSGYDDGGGYTGVDRDTKILGVDFPAFKLNPGAGILPISPPLSWGYNPGGLPGYPGNWFLTTCFTRGTPSQDFVWNSCSMPYGLGTTGSAQGSFDDMVTPAQAYGVDAKIDDGKPGTGNVRSIDALYPDYTAGQCVLTSAGTDYNLVRTDRVCALIVKMQ